MQTAQTTVGRRSAPDLPRREEVRLLVREQEVLGERGQSGEAKRMPRPKEGRLVLLMISDAWLDIINAHA